MNEDKIRVGEGGELLFDPNQEFTSVDLNKVEGIETVTSLTAISFEGERFGHCFNVETLILPKHIKEINPELFRFIRVTNVVWPDNCPVIEEETFAHQPLETIKNISNVTEIGKRAFIGCANLKKFAIPSKVSSIPSECFSQCTALKTITGTKHLKSIGEQAFYACGELEYIDWPKCITDIPNGCFHYCTSLKNVNNIDNVKNIGEMAFASSDLSEIGEFKSLETIGVGAFYNCSFETFKCPVTVKSIGSKAFKKCSALTTFYWPEKSTLVQDECFYKCSKLKSFYNIDFILYIGHKAFADCKELVVDFSIGFLNIVKTDSFSGAKYVQTSSTIKREV